MTHAIVKLFARMHVYCESVTNEVRLTARLRLLGDRAVEVEGRMITAGEKYTALDEQIKAADPKTREERDALKEQKAERENAESNTRIAARTLEEVGAAIEKTKAEIKNERDRRVHI